MNNFDRKFGDNFKCHYYKPAGKGGLTKVDNNACWAGCRYLSGKIYITKFKCKETFEYIDLIVKTMNNITPCKLVKINPYGKEIDAISFQLLSTYDKEVHLYKAFNYIQNLILLSFIRNLWWGGFHGGDGNTYSSKFFEILEKQKNNFCSLKKMMIANKEAMRIYSKQKRISLHRINTQQCKN